MPDRAAALAAFLSRSGWGDARRSPLAGDASNRRYERLAHPALGPAILMDAPPEKGEDVRPFVAIARHLAGLGLAAPALIAEDPAHGFLILQDLGDDLYARVVDRNPDLADTLYGAAIDVLVELAPAPLPACPDYGPPQMAQAAALAHDWYRLAATGTRDADRRAAFHDTVRQALDSHAAEMSALVLRDYHAENLIWLPDRAGTARVGLLDFQDAARGHPVYDLVSLLKDARRDLAPGLEARMIDRFLDRSGMAPEAFHAAYATLGAQRNLRILGGFARLSLHYGKPTYVDLIPRVWRHLQDSLAHPALATLAKVVNDDLPPPDPTLLQTLKDQCGTVPTP